VIVNYFFLTCCLSTFYIYGILKSDLLSPLSIHVLSWFIVSLFGFLFKDDFFNLTSKFFEIWLIWFFEISFIFYAICRKNKIIRQKFNLPTKFNYYYFLLFCNICGFIVIIKTGLLTPGGFSQNLRMAMLGRENSDLGTVFLTRVEPLMLVLLLYEYLANRQYKRNRYLLSLILWQLMYIVGSMSKMAIIMPLFSLLVVRYFKYKTPMKKLFFMICLLLLLVSTLQIIRDLGAEKSLDHDFFDLIAIYIYSPTLAFNEVISYKQLLNNNFGWFSLGFFYKIFGGVFALKDLGNPMPGWLFVPVPTNVSTGIYPFYYDFGIIGVIVFGLLISVFYATLFNAANRGSLFAILLFACTIGSLFLEIFNDTLVLGLSLLIQYIICIYAVIKLNAIEIRVKV